MIYVIYNSLKVPEYTDKVVAYKSLYNMRLLDKAHAEKIFLFDDGYTIYYKNRGENYQYSQEEQVVITLQAVLLY